MSVANVATVNPDGYPAPYGITVDPVIFTVHDGALMVLLAQRTTEPFLGRWALPGGFLGADESPEDTVARKLEEKTGLAAAGHLEQLRTYAGPGRDPRGWIITIAYLALVSHTSEVRDRAARWIPLAEVPALPFDHRAIIDDGRQRLAGKVWYTDIARGLLPTEFTMRQARAVYATITGRAYPRLDNFTRDFLRSQQVTATDHHADAGVGGGPRPRLYRFSEAS